MGSIVRNTKHWIGEDVNLRHVPFTGDWIKYGLIPKIGDYNYLSSSYPLLYDLMVERGEISPGPTFQFVDGVDPDTVIGSFPFVMAGQYNFDEDEFFINGEEGGVISATNTSDGLNFQDSAATTLVTATGQPVGRMLPKAGTYELFQAVSADRPSFINNAGIEYIQFTLTQNASIDFAAPFTGEMIIVATSGIFWLQCDIPAGTWDIWKNTAYKFTSEIIDVYLSDVGFSQFQFDKIYAEGVKRGSVGDFSTTISMTAWFFGRDDVWPKTFKYWSLIANTSLSNMFQNGRLETPLAELNKLPNCTNFNSLVLSTNYNLPVIGLDCSNGNRFINTFRNTPFFNQPIELLPVGNGATFESFLQQATSFNQPIELLNVGNGINFESFLYLATSFNQPIEQLAVVNGTNFGAFLLGATSFNQPIEQLAVVNGTNFGAFLLGATSFNQPMGSFNFDSVPANSATALDRFAENTNMSAANKLTLLQNWQARASGPQALIGMTTAISGGEPADAACIAARDDLVNNYGWTFTAFS